LGSEDAGHKNRYLILDVLGQGTFGQVVKCQNLKTQEVVAVKVIKNRTAYFNQSMMEVSVLDLVGKPLVQLSLANERVAEQTDGQERRPSPAKTQRHIHPQTAFVFGL
jgi:serine/threonine protein kinase